jgi:hypothetical protein
VDDFTTTTEIKEFPLEKRTWSRWGYIIFAFPTVFVTCFLPWLVAQKYATRSQAIEEVKALTIMMEELTPLALHDHSVTIFGTEGMPQLHQTCVFAVWLCNYDVSAEPSRGIPARLRGIPARLRKKSD